jgi:hypothetical protein
MAWQLKFSEQWQGSNGDPWPDPPWSTAGSGVKDQQSGRGRLQNTADWGDARGRNTANTFTVPFRMTGTVELSLPSSMQWGGINFLADASQSNAEPHNGYIVSWEPHNDLIYLDSYVSSSSTRLDSTTNLFDADAELDCEIIVENGVVDVYLWPAGTTQPGTPTLTASNSDHTSGNIAIWHIGGTGTHTVHLGQIDVYGEETDPPPDTPTNFTATTQDHQSIQLSADSATGADSYIIQRRPKQEA